MDKFPKSARDVVGYNVIEVSNVKDVVVELRCLGEVDTDAHAFHVDRRFLYRLVQLCRIVGLLLSAMVKSIALICCFRW